MEIKSKSLLAETEVSEDYSFSLPWLRSMRVPAGVPPFVQYSHNVRYSPDDVEAFNRLLNEFRN